MNQLENQRYGLSADGKFLYFDFIFLGLFGYKDFKDVNFFNEFGVYISDIDKIAIQVYSSVNSSFCLMLFDSLDVPNNSLNSMNFLGSHIFENFRRIDENLYQRDEDNLFFYETGINLRSMRIKRIGKIGEQDCRVRIKMIVRKI